jgi:cobyrinic acid a,c-diamide synthase
MSGGGKTTVVSALLRILESRGHKTAPFKCGPDYIDPMFHRAACGRQSVNLDLFFSERKELKSLFYENAAECDIALIEGVMGYYDGMEIGSAKASSYDVARTLDCPTVLIIPAKGMAYTIIPLIKGMVGQFEDSKIKAVILNNVTEMTYKQLKPIIERETGVKAAGYIPSLEHTLKSRHLGLVTPNKETEKIISEAADVISKTVDIRLLTELAENVSDFEEYENKTTEKSRIKIGVAYDSAFCFYYKDNFDLLKSMGAELVYFSPIKDNALPDDISGIIIGGGYPELYARELSDNEGMLRDIKDKIENGMPCLAECGGFMYLHSSMEDKNGISYKMAGVLQADAVKTDKLVRFGYINISGDNDFIKRGETIRAHEFHYWDSTDNGSSCRAEKPSGKRSWDCIHADKNLFAGFAHLYYRSLPCFAERFKRKCEEYNV